MEVQKSRDQVSLESLEKIAWYQSGINLDTETFRHFNILCFTCIHPVLSQCAKHCTSSWEVERKIRPGTFSSRPHGLVEETDP